MADLFCSFLDFRSLSTNYYYKLHLSCHCKNLTTSLVHSYNSTTTTTTRRKPLHLTLCSQPSSPNLDVIATHEHKDGSLLFRFGDPSEIVQNVKLEKFDNVTEEEEREGEGECSHVKVLDDDDKQVMVNRAETEVKGSSLIEVADEPNSNIISGKGINVEESEAESGETLLEGSKKIERPVSILSVESKVPATSGSEPVSVSGAETQVSATSGSEPVSISSAETKVSPTPDPDIQNNGYAQDILNVELEDSSPAEALVLDNIFQMENSVATTKPSEKKNADATTLPPVSFKPENNDSQSSSETAVTTNVLVDSELENMDDDVKNEIILDGKESDTSEILSDSPQLQPSTCLSEEAELENSQVTVQEVVAGSGSEGDMIDILTNSAIGLSAGAEVHTSTDVNEVPNDIVTGESESDAIQLMAVSRQLEMEPKLDDETLEKLQEDQFIIKGQSESSTIQLMPVSSQLETESKLDNETYDDTVVNTQEDQLIVKDQSESDMIQLIPASPQLAMESKLDNETDDDTAVKTQEDQLIVKDLSESDTIQLTPISSQLETESKLDDESGDGTVEKFQEDIVEDESKSDMVELMPVSPQLETESKLDDETGDDTVEKPQENQLIVKDQSESDTVTSHLETESKLDHETDDYPVEKTQEDQLIESESDTAGLKPVSLNLETESKLDEETDIDSLEDSQEYVEAENLTTLKDGPQDLTTATETTADNDDVQTSELLEAPGNEVTKSESTESATYSQEIAMSDFVLSSGAALLPHPSKVLTGGEDAYFVAGRIWIGVADGVGQWSLEGTNPGVYAQDLIRNCEKLVSGCDVNSINKPLDLLNLSVAETLSLGSSTVLIAQFDGQTLHVANIGDSGFIILRHGTVYKRSSPMLHLFHFPVQIERGDDTSHLAEFYQVDLEEEDVIITATDGLLDNLYDEEISSIVLKSLASDMKLEEVAELLADRAQEVGASAFARSPFADNAQAAGYVGYTGGKLDDVTVIISVVERTSDS